MRGMENIRNFVNDLVKEHNTTDPEVIADNLDINVCFTPLSSTVACATSFFDKFTIYVDRDLIEENEDIRDFVIAHELGHCLLGHFDDMGAGFFKGSEMYADFFAVCLLNHKILPKNINSINFQNFIEYKINCFNEFRRWYCEKS